MKQQILRSCFVGSLLLALVRLSEPAAGQVLRSKARPPGNFDIRVNAPASAINAAGRSPAQVRDTAQTQTTSTRVAIANLKATTRGAQVALSGVTNGVETVHALRGLNPATPGSGAEIVRQFLGTHRELYGLGDADMAGLHFIGESVSPRSGLRMVRVEQTVNGRPIFQSESRFILDRTGRLFRSTGLMARDAGDSALGLTGLISAEQALAAAMQSVGIPLDAKAMQKTGTSPDGLTTKLSASDSEIAGEVPSQIVYFPLAPGVLVPAWSQVTFTNGEADWYTLVDARTGTLLWRKNIRSNASSHDARFRVYVQADGITPADNPAPLSPTTATVGSNTQPPGIAPTIVSMHTAMALFGNVSQNGWINDCPGGVCTANETQTIGNNVHAYLDRVGGGGAGGANDPDIAPSSVLDGTGKPMGNPDANARNRDFLGTTPRDFQTNFLPPPQGGDPETGQTATGNGDNGTLPVDQFRRGVVTQLFYVANWYHDRLYNLGFDEAAGNFQGLNFSGMGLGNDRVLAEAQDSTDVDNANFSTPPDGLSGRAQMYRFTGPTIDRDGDLDTEVLIHELTHGTSNRLIGNASGLVWDPARGLGEGWSDFYALSLLNNTNADDPNGSYAAGAYATYKVFSITTYTDNYVYGIRRFPYSTNNTVNPLTWADVDDYTNDLSGGIAPDPLGFNIGGAQEVHSTGEVWCLTLWEVRSRIIAANASDVPTGNQMTLQLVTDAMKMTPLNPNYLDARDAILDADCATNACANEQSIWDGFADRGLGYNAKVSTAYGFAPITSHQGIVESFSAPFLDVASVAIDDSGGNSNGAIEPGEPIKLTVTLTNPWRNASKNVASASATLSSSTAGVVIYDNSSNYPAIPAQGSASGDTFLFTVPTSAVCGQTLNFTIATTSSLGNSSISLAFRVGAPSGTAAPITYTRTPGSPLAIPDFRARGTIDSMTITDDFEIADINVRIDSIPHTFPGDLTFGFKAPNGYGVDLVTFIGGAVAGGGDGNNITNMVIDNQAVADILLATNAQAPYTGSWLPIANSPSWPVLGFGPPEPVGELNKLNGAATMGNWSVLVSDQAAADTGTLNGWSLIITPRFFACTSFSPIATVSGTQTVSGTFESGGSVTYTVTLTNSGSGVQGDNPGDEFSEVLPSTLTLTGATASSGTATPTLGTNTVTWNGALAPLGGSVTITINATINAGADGQVVAAQGTINYDGDVNGTNESSAVTDDPSVGGASDPTVFTVALAGATHFAVTAPASATTGSAVSITVTALDATDSVVPGYTGTVHFTSSDGGAGTMLPADYTFIAGDNGTHAFTNGVVFSTPGNQTVTATDTSVPSITGTSNTVVVNAPPPNTAVLRNLSTRMRVETGDNVGIGGFIISGSAPKKVIIRAIGPDLMRFGLTDLLTDPVLELHGTGAFATIVNDNWRDTQESEIAATGIPPVNTAESAIVVTLDPGAYTAIVRGKNGTGGLALVEVYDLEPSSASSLVNLSTRARINSGQNLVIAGFILSHSSGNDSVVIRGLGPSLAPLGVPNVLANPSLQLRDHNGSLIRSNNDWQDDPAQAVAVSGAGLAPGNSAEAAIFASLPPGAYTALLTGEDGGVGVGLVEIYQIGITPP